jgi:replicative DNA helicase
LSFADAHLSDLAEETAPPLCSLEAEQALLGCVLYINEALDQVGTLEPTHFYEPIHQRLFGFMAQRQKTGRPFDAIAIQNHFAGDEAFEGLGAMSYLGDLVDRAPPTAHVAEYATIIQDWAIKRDLLAYGHDVARLVYEEADTAAFEMLGQARARLDGVELAATPAEHTIIAAPEAAAQALEEMRKLSETGKKRGRMTGLRCTDRRLGGLRPGALIVIGGRPSMGKTSLARAIAHGAADRNPDALALFLGIEMGPEEMMQRELSALSWEVDQAEAVQYRNMGDGALMPMDFQILSDAHRLVPPNLLLDDCHTLSVEDVRRKVWSIQRKAPLACVVIDYLQLMRRPAAKGRNEATVLGEMTSSLKQIARQAKTCIVLLSQLSRGVEMRDDKRPQLNDLRESGAIEQDADAVLFPFREVYYLERAEPKAGTPEHQEWEMACSDLRTRLDVICAKQRQGPVGSDRQVYRPEFDHISDYREER